MFKTKMKNAILAAAAICMVGGSALAYTPAEQTYQEALAYAAAHPEGSYTLQADAELPFLGNAAATSVSYVKLTPFQVRSDSQVTLAGKSSEWTSCYVEQNGADLIAYYPVQSAEGQKPVWHKMSVPLPSAQPLGQTLAKQNEKHNVLSGVKSVTAVGNNTYQVVYDMSRVYKEGDEAEWKKEGLTKKEDIAAVKQFLVALRDSGDLTVTFTVDPATKRILSATAPATPQLQAVLGSALDAAAQKAPDKKAELSLMKSYLQNSKVNLQYRWAQLPQNIELQVPQTVKKDAIADKNVH